MSALERILYTPLKSKGRNVMTLTGGYAVAAVNTHMNDAEAYATLFATSVEMLEALHASADRLAEIVAINGGDSNSDVLAEVRRVIAKAEGRDQ